MKKELHVDIKNLEQKAIELNQQKYELIKEIGELADEIIDEFIQQKIENSFDLTQLEDWYLPYKKKRKTKASVAREKGLEPLAKILMKQKSI